MSTEKVTRYTPTSFLEMDDLHGGRKIVMVGADGITYWDALDVERVTPVVIHPVFKPKAIGGLVAFARQHDMIAGLRALTARINDRQADRAKRDPLYVMRAMVAYSTGVADGSDAALDAALAAANAEEKLALDTQEVIERYVEVTEKEASHGRVA